MPSYRSRSNQASSKSNPDIVPTRPQKKKRERERRDVIVDMRVPKGWVPVTLPIMQNGVTGPVPAPVKHTFKRFLKGLEFDYLSEAKPTSYGEKPEGSQPTESPSQTDSSQSSDPFTIHHSDNPTAILVTPHLSGDNYGSWSRAMTMALRAKNTLGFVNGTIKKPSTKNEIAIWERCNDMVSSWLLNSVSPDIRTSIMYTEEASAIWADLDERFSQSNAPKIYQLKQSIATLKQDDLSVSVYFTRLKALRDELNSISPPPACICGNGKLQIEKLNQDHAMEFLQGIHDRFSTIRSQILLMDPFPSITRIYSLLRQEEKQQEINTSSVPFVESAALHTRSTTPQSSNKRQRPFCEHCNRLGHTKATCFKLHGYPPKKATPTKPPQTDHLAGTTLPFSSSLWIIDSGASNHICYSLSQLQSYYDAPSNCFVHLPDGTYAQVLHLGSVKLSPYLILHNVFHISNFKFNLLSIKQLTSSLHCIAIFFDSNCFFQDRRTKKVIGRGSSKDGLYYFTATAFCNSIISRNFDLWHWRLGHPSLGRFRFLTRTFDYIKSSGVSQCDVCPQAKQCRLPFNKSVSICNKPFELLHCDLWGPFSTPTHTSTRYFLTIVDDFTRCTWLYFMKTKSETCDLLLYFFQLVHRQFHSHVSQIKYGSGPIFLPHLQTIRSDNGTEFLSTKIQNFFKSHGIIHQRSCVHTPQQNGVVERKHRHLLNVARALRFQAHLPVSFWGECILTAAYIINKLPTPNLRYKSPHELLFGSPPDYNNLRVFGCLCFARNINIKNKFDARANPGIFVGYPYGKKGYKIFDPITRTIYTSRDVIFRETTFPFQDRSLSSPDKSVHIVPLEDLNFFDFSDIPSIVNTRVDCPTRDNMPSSSMGENSTDLSPTDVHPSPETSPTDVHPSPETSPTDVHPYPETSPPNVHRSADPTPTTVHPSPMDTAHVESRPHRTTKIPARFNDYLCPTLKDKSSYPFANYLNLTSLSSTHRAFISTILSHDEPSSFTQAMKSVAWRDAMSKEIKALEDNETWDLTSLPQGKHPIGSKWVFKIKYNSDGSIERYKARLVAKGYNQVEGIDYHDTFAPVAKLVTVRILLSISAIKQWPIHQLDINNAFLQGDLHEDVYMKLPPGFSKKGETRVCKLKKSLYGLKQASRQWFSKFSSTLITQGFHQSLADYSLFTLHKDSISVFVLVYVDDIIITGNDDNEISKVKKFLEKSFSIKDLGPLKYFLGIEVSRSSRGIFLCQRKYILDILKDTGMTGARVASFPMEQHLHLKPNDGTPLPDPTRFRRLIGRLLYLSVTRPDIQYAVNNLSQFMQSPHTAHLDAAHRVLRYLKGTISKGILLSSASSLHLSGFSDSDWLGCPTSRRSTTGYFTMLGSSPISWKSKKQPTVSRSSAEAEYRALAYLTCELQWLKYLLTDLGVPHSEPFSVYCDNQVAVHIAENPVFHERTKHIELDCHTVREKLQSKLIVLCHLRSTDQLADIFTKPLGADQFQRLVHKLGVVDISPPMPT
ncbi:hypothetical protein OSB04_015455 [Centaurea solstitialis]|uniref:Integrase catalytic domain-containing protein n=1 Tax=Centaurea solstitialis TaxID=347529 RepID=A0AA38TB29_9ASTR|nr:hypothetical protein OSB04_015455 [Centaurea solstitialis]